MASVTRRLELVPYPGTERDERQNMHAEVLSILDSLAIVDDVKRLVFTVTFAADGEVEPIRRAAERAAQAWGMCDVIILPVRKV